MATLTFEWDSAGAKAVESAQPQSEPPKQAPKPTWIDALSASWRGAGIAFALLCAVVFAIYRWGVPLGAHVAAKAMPNAWAGSIESAVLKDLDDSLCKPTALSDARQAQLQRGFQRLQAATSSTVRPAGEAKLLLRSCPLIGPNAFNLGRTTIVLTDAMVSFASNPASPEDDSAILGVLAHELGHLQNDHVMRGLFHSAGVGMLATVLLGDVSGLLAAAPAIVLRNQFTRGFEREADSEALARLQAAGISSKPLAAMFKKLSAMEPSSKKMEWLFSHPDSGERATLFER
jgi:Zn-dependent protease with chaperone function